MLIYLVVLCLDLAAQQLKRLRGQGEQRAAVVGPPPLGVCTFSLHALAAALECQRRQNSISLTVLSGRWLRIPHLAAWAHVDVQREAQAFQLPLHLVDLAVLGGDAPAGNEWTGDMINSAEECEHLGVASAMQQRFCVHIAHT